MPVLAVLISLCRATPAGGAWERLLLHDICDINAFLEECPTSDPAYNEIRNDFRIRKDGQLVGEISCQEPISQLPISQYTDELIVLQTLRTIYHVDRGRKGHLPWTSGTLYEWLKAMIGGINITSTGPDQCCFQFDGDVTWYFNVRAGDEEGRNHDRKWVGIADNISLMMHERRHLNGFGHVSCCSAGEGACDQTYDETNLSPYGVQWWLEKNWIEGGIYTGYSCLSTQQEVNDITNWLRMEANGRRSNFCENPPPLLTDENNPVGACGVCFLITSLLLWPKKLLTPVWALSKIWLIIPLLAVAVIGGLTYYALHRKRSRL